MKTSPTTRRRGTSPQFAVHEFPCADILALLLYGFVEERVPGWYGSECGELAGSERRSQEESAEPRNSVRAASSSGTWTRRSRHRYFLPRWHLTDAGLRSIRYLRSAVSTAPGWGWRSEGPIWRTNRRGENRRRGYVPRASRGIEGSARPRALVLVPRRRPRPSR